MTHRFTARTMQRLVFPFARTQKRRMNNPGAHTARMRLDQLLVARYGYESRSRARDAILRGSVRRNGGILDKPGLMVADGIALDIDDEASRYVSRAALKLSHALDYRRGNPAFDPKGKTALDIGASTGGFTQVLLEAGAEKVFAVDVGSGQFHPSLAGDARIRLIENLNARDLTADHLDGTAPDFIVCDASFISLKLVLPPALALAAPGAAGIFLVKPQFEVGRENLGKGGIVKDEETAMKAALDLSNWLGEQPGWQATDLISSPIEGGDGNREFLLFGEKR